MNDNDVAIIHRKELILKTLNNDKLIPKIQTIDLDTREIEKDGFEHFMLKEIFEQPRSILDTSGDAFCPIIMKFIWADLLGDG